MYFLDLKKREIVEVNSNWNTQIYIVNCTGLLDMRPNEAMKRIQRVLSISFVERTVLVHFKVENVENIDDFEILCDLLISGWFERNTKTEMRPKEELRLAVPQGLRDRLNCDYMNLKNALDKEYYNRYFNLTIATDDGNYKFELINPPKGDK
jgi:hypothetical protein